MKFIKILFGRVAMILTAILLQFIFIMLVISFHSEDYFIYQIATYVLSTLTIINLINRDMNQDSKLPWAIFIVLIPIFGSLSYFLFSKNVISRRQRKLFKEVYENGKEVLKHYDDNDCCMNDTRRKDLDEYFGQSEYIHRKTSSVPYNKTYTKFYPSGEVFFEEYVETIKKAKKFIFLEYFIIEEGKMWNTILDILQEKVKEGVEVRVLYDDIGSILKVTSNYWKKLNKMGINCVKFNRFTPFISAIHNNRDHRKITIVDGVIGFVGGINLADEYINHTHPHGYWKDTAVMLKGEAVKTLTVMFLQSFDVMMKKTNSYDAYLPEVFEQYPEEGYSQPFGDGPRPIYDDYIAKNIYLNIINQARRYVYITTPYLIIDSELRSALISAANRGVDVRIITPGKPDKKLIFNITRANYMKLIKERVKIYEYQKGFIHSKTIISDDVVGIVGTINLDYRSLVHHYECGVWMYKTEALKQLKEDIDKTFEESLLQTEQTARLNPLQRIFCTLIMIFTPLL